MCRAWRVARNAEHQCRYGVLHRGGICDNLGLAKCAENRRAVGEVQGRVVVPLVARLVANVML